MRSAPAQIPLYCQSVPCELALRALDEWPSLSSRYLTGVAPSSQETVAVRARITMLVRARTSAGSPPFREAAVFSGTGARRRRPAQRTTSLAGCPVRRAEDRVSVPRSARSRRP